MQLAISNIAWEEANDTRMYAVMQELGYRGLEIAPTRFVGDMPYEMAGEGAKLSQNLMEKYGLSIASMQSIWFGKKEAIYGSEEERKFLLDYTRKAIDFSALICCKNIVFGCPKNRFVPAGQDLTIIYEFLSIIGRYASQKGVHFALEANPPIYGTNFVNTTQQAFQLVRMLKIPGLTVNIDVGAMIHNNEDVRIIEDNMDIISHIHISEPGLENIKQRTIHEDLAKLLRSCNYEKYVSIEMKLQPDVNLILQTMGYIKEYFG